MVVQHNLSAMTANRYYTNNNSALGKSMEKLSSGLAINRAGDNAAGLAVSEKMRAQISGLNQASKNAQDGISMVQTFEGALQETDSILQRMRTLAVQSANGSYQNEVDRDAIQLEFDQLNDELNQIADTDYNGIVVLNGGKMADGTVETDGTFDYVSAAKAKANETAAKAKALAGAKDFSGDTSAVGGSVDSTKYDDSVADSVWDKLGLDEVSSGKDTLSVTLVRGENGNWKASGLSLKNTDSSGTDTEIELDEETVNAALAKITGAGSDNGGFELEVDGVSTGVKVIFNTNDASQYDTATIELENTGGKKVAPSEIGFDEGTMNKLEGTATKGLGTDIYASGFDSDNKPEVAFEDGIFDDSDKMSGLKAAVLTALDNIDLTFEYKSGQDQQTENLKATGTTANVNVGDYDYSISASDGKISIFEKGGSTAIGEVSFTAVDNGKSYNIQYKGTATAGKTDAELGTDGNAKTIATFTVGKLNTASSSTTATDRTVKTGFNIDGFAFEKADPVTARSVATPQAEIDKVKNGSGNDDAAAGSKVSTSNTYNAGQRNLTYAKDMTLQTGARSKDIVKFKFNYTSTGIGELESDLNASAEGLGTKDLDLTNQEGANKAIDAIDNAINKVSMIRGTFGAIQNRLEHKINNIDTNAENITAAESRIRDTQMDQEMMKFTSAQILSQASQSMLAQANSLPQGVLQLLG